MDLKIRPFDPVDAEYEAAVGIFNANWPDELQSVEGWQYRDRTRSNDYLFRRLVGEVDGKIVTTGVYGESQYAYVKGKYFVGVEVHPDHQRRGYGSAMYDRILEELGARDPLFITADTREDKPDFIRFLEKRGFVRTMRYAVSRLAVDKVDFSNFAELEERLRESGIEIVPVPALMERDPDWKRKWYELESETWMDVPLPEPPTKGTFEDFCTRFESPHYDANAHFIALDGERYVGLTGMWTSPVEKTKLYTGLTAVVRSHRRRGVATALKVRGFRYAKDCGAAVVETDNEENNPMFVLNQQLGFEEQPSWLDFRNVLREPREGESIPEVKSGS